MAFYEGVNAETGDWGTTTIEKNMFRRGAPTHQRGDRVYCVGPQWTVTSLPSFADDPHGG